MQLIVVTAYESEQTHIRMKCICLMCVMLAWKFKYDIIELNS